MQWLVQCISIQGDSEYMLITGVNGTNQWTRNARFGVENSINMNNSYTTHFVTESKKTLFSGVCHNFTACSLKEEGNLIFDMTMEKLIKHPSPDFVCLSIQNLKRMHYLQVITSRISQLQLSTEVTKSSDLTTRTITQLNIQPIISPIERTHLLSQLRS